jgi:hypothetical protein
VHAAESPGFQIVQALRLLLEDFPIADACRENCGAELVRQFFLLKKKVGDFNFRAAGFFSEYRILMR